MDKQPITHLKPKVFTLSLLAFCTIVSLLVAGNWVYQKLPKYEIHETMIPVTPGLTCEKLKRLNPSYKIILCYCGYDRCYIKEKINKKNIIQLPKGFDPAPQWDEICKTSEENPVCAGYEVDNNNF